MLQVFVKNTIYLQVEGSGNKDELEDKFTEDLHAKESDDSDLNKSADSAVNSVGAEDVDFEAQLQVNNQE